MDEINLMLHFSWSKLKFHELKYVEKKKKCDYNVHKQILWKCIF